MTVAAALSDSTKVSVEVDGLRDRIVPRLIENAKTSPQSAGRRLRSSTSAATTRPAALRLWYESSSNQSSRDTGLNSRTLESRVGKVTVEAREPRFEEGSLHGRGPASWSERTRIHGNVTAHRTVVWQVLSRSAMGRSVFSGREGGTASARVRWTLVVSRPGLIPTPRRCLSCLDATVAQTDSRPAQGGAIDHPTGPGVAQRARPPRPMRPPGFLDRPSAGLVPRHRLARRGGGNSQSDPRRNRKMKRHLTTAIRSSSAIAPRFRLTLV